MADAGLVVGRDEERRAARERWTALLAEWRSSGRPGQAFCRERGLVYAQWLYWRRRLAAVRVPPGAPAPRPSASTADFVVLPTGATGEPGSCGLRLRVAGTWELVLERGFDEAELRRVLRVLGTPC